MASITPSSQVAGVFSLLEGLDPNDHNVRRQVAENYFNMIAGQRQNYDKTTAQDLLFIFTKYDQDLSIFGMLSSWFMDNVEDNVDANVIQKLVLIENRHPEVQAMCLLTSWFADKFQNIDRKLTRGDIEQTWASIESLRLWTREAPINIYGRQIPATPPGRGTSEQFCSQNISRHTSRSLWTPSVQERFQDTHRHNDVMLGGSVQAQGRGAYLLENQYQQLAGLREPLFDNVLTRGDEMMDSGGMTIRPPFEMGNNADRLQQETHQRMSMPSDYHRRYALGQWKDARDLIIQVTRELLDDFRPDTQKVINERLTEHAKDLNAKIKVLSEMQWDKDAIVEKLKPYIKEMVERYSRQKMKDKYRIEFKEEIKHELKDELDKSIEDKVLAGLQKLKDSIPAILEEGFQQRKQPGAGPSPGQIPAKLQKTAEEGHPITKIKQENLKSPRVSLENDKRERSQLLEDDPWNPGSKKARVERQWKWKLEGVYGAGNSIEDGNLELEVYDEQQRWRIRNIDAAEELCSEQVSDIISVFYSENWLSIRVRHSGRGDQCVDWFIDLSHPSTDTQKVALSLGARTICLKDDRVMHNIFSNDYQQKHRMFPPKGAGIPEHAIKRRQQQQETRLKSLARSSRPSASRY